MKQRVDSVVYGIGYPVGRDSVTRENRRSSLFPETIDAIRRRACELAAEAPPFTAERPSYC